MREDCTRTPTCSSLAQLEVDASEQLEVGTPVELASFDGVEIFVKMIRDKYEPLEHRRVRAIMDQFLVRFDHRADGEINDYLQLFDEELADPQKMARKLTANSKAQLFFKKMRLREGLEALASGKHAFHG